VYVDVFWFLYVYVLTVHAVQIVSEKSYSVKAATIGVTEQESL